MENADNTFLMELISAGWMISIVLCLVLGVSLLFLESKLGERSKWVVSFGALLPLLTNIVIVVNQFQYVDRGILGWVLPREITGAIRIGYSPDLYTFGLTATLSVAVILRVFLAEIPKMASSAFLIGMSGLALSWSSKTIWLGIVGVVLAAIAGVLILVGSYETQDDSHFISQFIKRHAVGILLTVIGAGGLLSLGGSLDYADNTPLWSALTEKAEVYTSLGFLVVGLVLLVLPVTSLSGLMKETKLKEFEFNLLIHLLPAIAAASIFQKLHRQLFEMGVLNWIGILVLILGYLLILPLFFQKTFKGMFNYWTALFPVVSLIALCWGGVWSFYILTFTFFVQSMVMGFLINQPKDPWTMSLFTAASGAIVGVLGYSTAGGYLDLFSRLEADVPEVVAVATLFLLYQVGSWRVLIKFLKKPETSETVWWVSTTLTFLVLAPLGVFYAGAWTGGALIPGSDEILWAAQLPWVGVFNQRKENFSEDIFIISSAIHWGIFVISLILASLTVAGERDRLSALPQKFPKLDHWFSVGLGFDHLAKSLSDLGVLISKDGVQKGSMWVWEKSVPALFVKLNELIKDAGVWIDAKSEYMTSNRFKALVDAPAKLIQLTQSGDLQWYLFFSIGWTVLILMHFINF